MDIVTLVTDYTLDNSTIQFSMKIKKVGIIGHKLRDSDEETVNLLEVLLAHDLIDNVEFVSGGCPSGGDRMAEQIAKECNIPIIIHYPDKSNIESRWDAISRYMDRNTLISNDSDVLVAMIDVKYKGTDDADTLHNIMNSTRGGTNDTIRKFTKKFPTKEIIFV